MRSKRTIPTVVTQTALLATNIEELFAIIRREQSTKIGVIDMAKQDIHGAAALYRYGCRCDKCRMAQRDRLRAYRATKKIEARDSVQPAEAGTSGK